MSTKRAISVESLQSAIDLFTQLNSNAQDIINQLNKTGGVDPVWINTNIPPNTVGGFKNDTPATPEEGLNFGQAMDKLLFPSIAPTLSLSMANTSKLEYLDPTVSFTININASANTAGATISAIKVEKRRTGESNYQVLHDGSVISSYTIVDNSNVTLQSYEFRITVTDSSGASKVEFINKDFNPRVAPTLVSTQANTAVNPSSTIEVGSINAIFSKTVLNNTPNTTLGETALLQVLSGSTVIHEAPFDINSTASVELNQSQIAGLIGAKSVSVKVSVTDFDILRPSGQTTTITGYSATLAYKNFFGASDAPLNSDMIRSLSSVFENVTSFTLNTGNTAKKYYIAVPANKTLVSVIDADASNANVTSAYILTQNVSIEDAGGNNVLYNLYTMTNGVAYSSSHRHIVTIQ